MGIKRISRAIREGRYDFTIHALEEMNEDDLDESDVRYGILHGGERYFSAKSVQEMQCEMTKSEPPTNLVSVPVIELQHA